MTDLRLIVFDVDGTLVDSEGPFREALGLALAAEGVSLPEGTDPCSGIGLSPVQMFLHLFPESDNRQAERLAEAYRTAYLDLRASGRAEQAAPLFPGTREMLEMLAAEPRTLLGIATGKARRGVDFFLAHHGLNGVFHTIQAADAHPSKPAPSMLHAAMAETGVPAMRSVMIGDTTFDMTMANNAGMAAVGVNWGHHDADALRAAGACAVIDDWRSLAAALPNGTEEME